MKDCIIGIAGCKNSGKDTVASMINYIRIILLFLIYKYFVADDHRSSEIKHIGKKFNFFTI